MKDWFLIPIMLVMFAFCCYVGRKFVSGGIRQKKDGVAKAPKKTMKLRIGLENHGLWEDISKAAQCCLDAFPTLKFLKSYGDQSKLLNDLEAGEVDLVLLWGLPVERLPESYAFVSMPDQAHGKEKRLLYEDDEEDRVITDIVAVWNEKRASSELKQIIQIIKEEQYLLDFGYCESMN